MGHPQVPGQQGDLSIGQGSGRPVAQIPQNGVADGGELGADLVAAAGVKGNGHQRSIERFAQPAVGQACGLGAVGVRLGHAARGAVAHQMVGQLPGFGFQAAVNHGQVVLGHPALPELSAETRRCLGGAGKEHHPGHGAIEPVHEA